MAPLHIHDFFYTLWCSWIQGQRQEMTQGKHGISIKAKQCQNSDLLATSQVI